MIAYIQVDWTGMKDFAWIYLFRSGKLGVWTTLFDCLVVSTCKFCCPVSCL